MKLVSAHKCDWCNRCFMNKGTAFSHEWACKNNPSRRHCVTCTHSCIAVTGMTEPPFDGAEPYEETGPWCELHNKAIKDKPYLIECDYNTSGWGDEGYPVPGTCEGYEYKGYAGWKEPVRRKKEAVE